MESIYIPKIDTQTDWFNDAVLLIEERTGAEVIWELIDDDANSLGDLMGWFRQDGKIYRAEHDDAGSDDDEDRIVFRPDPHKGRQMTEKQQLATILDGYEHYDDDAFDDDNDGWTTIRVAKSWTLRRMIQEAKKFGLNVYLPSEHGEGGTYRFGLVTIHNSVATSYVDENGDATTDV
ncbi:MAG: hypothetical protein ABF271_12730 [Abyssibacter sp.]|uniref:hypothetical protein n=1 Tax=Abyssibacter sp. TaxID=2320200 RepID=UPI00321919A9